jgi:ankyrin repeat protein
MKIFFFWILLFYTVGSYAQLLPSTNKKPVPSKPANNSKPASKPATKPAAIPEKQAVKANDIPQKQEVKPVYDDQEVILFASLDELKNYKAAGKVSRWSPERKILLYNLFRDKQLSNLTELGNEVKTLLNNHAAIPGTYKTVNDSWGKLFIDQNWLKYSNVQSINTLRESLQALESQYKGFAEQYLNFVKRQKLLPDARILDEYHQQMFDKAIGSGEADVVNKMINVNNTINSDLASLKDIGLLMERSLNDLNTNLDKVARTKTKNFTPFTPLNKMGETPIVSLTTNVSNTAGSSAVVQNVKSSDLEGTILPAGKFSYLEISSPRIKALKQGNISAFRSFITNDINQPQEELKGHTPLIYALVYGGDLKIIKNLIESGADLNTSTYEASWTINKTVEKVYLSPLFIFCMAYSGKEPENISFLNYLIEKGAKHYLQLSPIKRYAAASFMIYFMTSTSQRKAMMEQMKKVGINLEGDASLNFLK